MKDIGQELEGPANQLEEMHAGNSLFQVNKASLSRLMIDITTSGAPHKLLAPIHAALPSVRLEGQTHYTHIELE